MALVFELHDLCPPAAWQSCFSHSDSFFKNYAGPTTQPNIDLSQTMFNYYLKTRAKSLN